MNGKPALSLGVVIGGTSASRTWEVAVKRLARHVIDAREGVVSPLAVNVVYQIPGEHVSPDFTGVRAGRFSRKNSELLVQVALPLEPSGDPYMEALTLLHEAVNAAERFASQHGLVEGRLVELHDLLGRL